MAGSLTGRLPVTVAALAICLLAGAVAQGQENVTIELNGTQFRISNKRSVYEMSAGHIQFEFVNDTDTDIEVIVQAVKCGVDEIPVSDCPFEPHQPANCSSVPVTVGIDGTATLDLFDSGRGSCVFQTRPLGATHRFDFGFSARDLVLNSPAQSLDPELQIDRDFASRQLFRWALTAGVIGAVVSLIYWWWRTRRKPE